jgi:ATP-dependent helicase/nuclease subunit B
MAACAPGQSSGKQGDKSAPHRVSLHFRLVEPDRARPPITPQSATQLAVFGCLERGGTVVTANSRAARSLRLNYSSAQQAAGRQAWLTPPIHDWESWLSILWQQHLQNSPDAPLLLTTFQERGVWKKITAAKTGDSEAIAALACDAWRLLSDFAAHRERNRSWNGWGSADAEAFREWAARFDRDGRRGGWISRSSLAALLEESIRQGMVELPAEILLIGFDRFTPSRRALINAARTAGASIHQFQAPGVMSLPQVVEARDARDELATCAWWARRLLEANPTSRIAIIAQEISKSRGEIERIFLRILVPESVGIEAAEAMPFEFSLGPALASVPAISAALLLLRWMVEPLDQAAVSWLLMSGFLSGDSEDLDEMAAFDADARKSGWISATMPVETVCRSRALSEAARKFLGRLRRVQRAAHAGGVGNRQKDFLDWVELSEILLRHARWPGGRVLGTVEFQALRRWERLLGDVAGLSFDQSQVTYEEFVTTLDRYANETIFARESRNAPIQIMGALESAGQEFDALWFLGVDYRARPSTAQPHPLLPRELQRKYGMPHATVEIDWDLAVPVTQRIAASSPLSVFSYPQRDDTGELRPSPLLIEAFGPLPLQTTEYLRTTLRVPEEPSHVCSTEAIEDASSVPWPRELRAGGAEILKRQSACAFQSFAARRLGAAEIDEAERGLNARDRGNILHKVLESLWSPHNAEHIRLQTRDDLFNAISSGQLEAILREHIQSALDKYEDRDRGSSWTRSYLRAEQERLHALLSRWLAYEAERHAFTVLEQEKRIETNVNGLQLSLRVDRIDLVDDGHLILDYKTGKVSPAMWEGDRPDDPQLPLYGIHHFDTTLRGLLVAHVAGKEMGFDGRAEDATRTVTNTLGPQSNLVKNPLTEQTLDDWADVLTNLADNFLDGKAEVDPKIYPQTCKFCALPGLCRVAETPVPLEGDEDRKASVDGEASTIQEGNEDE